jgi:hypothetical protein
VEICAEIFSIFFTEFVGQKKVRSWEYSAWELREFSGEKIEENENNLKK